MSDRVIGQVAAGECVSHDIGQLDKALKGYPHGDDRLTPRGREGVRHPVGAAEGMN